MKLSLALFVTCLTVVNAATSTGSRNGYVRRAQSSGIAECGAGCSADSDCNDGLVCYTMDPTTSLEKDDGLDGATVPGCGIYVFSQSNYCVQADNIPSSSSSGSSGSSGSSEGGGTTEQEIEVAAFCTSPPCAELPITTYQPGCFDWGYWVRDKDNKRIRVANGVWGRPVAYVGEPVEFVDGTNSLQTRNLTTHPAMDGAGLFVKDDGSGFYYASNSEEGDSEKGEFTGGVFTFELDNNHNVVDYYQSLSGTVDNCAGGKTPWGTWVSCEEEDGYGRCWQVDPANKDQTGPTASQVTAVTAYRANWEAFAWDDKDWPPRGYVTDDAEPEDAPAAYGALNRFTPDEAALECYKGTTKAEKWCTLNSGTHDFLKMHPGMGGSNCGKISWVKDPLESSAADMRKAEGIDIDEDRIMRFVAKEDRLYFEVNLAEQTYCRYSTLEGFAQEPDNARKFGDTTYICNDGRTPNGVYGRNGNGEYFMIFMEFDYLTEIAGLDFSPDGKVAYVVFQDNAMWQFWRLDGKSFNDPVDKYCAMSNPNNVDNTEQVLEPMIKGFATEVVEELMEL